MVIEWAKEAVLDQILVQIILNDARWIREYLIYREFGHRSVFGEESLSDMSSDQLKLLSLSQLYDVVRNGITIHDSYEEGNVKTEIPEKVMPYPGKLLRWYEDWQDRTKRTRQAASKTGKTKGKTQNLFRDDETDEQAFAAYAKSRAKLLQQANDPTKPKPVG